MYKQCARCFNKMVIFMFNNPNLLRCVHMMIGEKSYVFS